MLGKTAEFSGTREDARLQALLCAARDLLETGDEEACPGFIEVTARTYRDLQAALRELTGRYHGIDVSDAIAIRHEEEQ